MIMIEHEEHEARMRAAEADAAARAVQPSNPQPAPSWRPWHVDPRSGSLQLSHADGRSVVLGASLVVDALRAAGLLPPDRRPRPTVYRPGYLMDAPEGSPSAPYADPIPFLDERGAVDWAIRYVRGFPAWRVAPLPCSPPSWGVQLAPSTDPNAATWACEPDPAEGGAS